MINNLLVANRGEIAIRVIRAASELGISTVAVFSEDDGQSLHTRKADQARPLRGNGPAAYLDIEQILTVAAEAGCDAIHPGYGFLAENSQFARRCAECGLTFVGPRPDILDLFGDKAQARLLAQRLAVPVAPGTFLPTSLSEAREFLSSLGTGGVMIVKAIAGGGGRGMRMVSQLDEVEEAFQRCQSEAQAAFGDGSLYVEELIPRARHIEVQIVGDGTGNVSHLWERECSIQRRHQKLVEIAPSPYLSDSVRDRLSHAATTMAREVRYNSLGTFEFLVDVGQDTVGRFAFIEANARLQVEHTVTEEVTGVDLVKTQLQLASGSSLSELGLDQDEIPAPRGFAIQVRVNMESMLPDGAVKPSGGRITAFEVPSGPGVRVDSFGYAGYTTSPRFDSLLAKVIAHSRSSDPADAIAKAYRALCEFRVEGVATNIPFLLNLLRNPEFVAQRWYTRFLDDYAAELVAPSGPGHRRLFVENGGGPKLAGVKVAAGDPLALFGVTGDGQAVASSDVSISSGGEIVGPENTVAIAAPVQGTIVSIDLTEGELIRKGQQLLVIDSMKMEYVIRAHVGGIVRRLTVSPGDTVFEGHPLAFVEETDEAGVEAVENVEVDLDHIRPDLAAVLARQALLQDAARPEAVGRRRKTGQRTARENVVDLCDADSFIEYGGLVIAGQQLRRSTEDLIKNTPADGMIAGIGSVNGDLFDESKSRCAVLAYDYTVLAGTQGMQNHRKKDRLLAIAQERRLPVVIFTEGGGGRPGESDWFATHGLHTPTFRELGKLSGLVPLVAINSGRCFAGNAVLLGECDVVIATKNSNIGMGGPAMVEGGGLGVFRTEEIGPIDVQTRNGVVDIAVADEAESVAVARQYLSYFQGPLADWQCADQRLLRNSIPENRLRIYDIRTLIETLVDTGSILELRRDFGVGVITAFARIEGRPMGLIADNPAHLGGAIDSDAADKATRFAMLCNAFDIPLLILVDTPGNMVGPEAEKSAIVRHCSRMFVIGANLTTPSFAVVLRKAYGLGAVGLCGGGMHSQFFAIAWPTSEFGGFNLEGGVKLGYRKQLAEIADPIERKALFDRLVAEAYEETKGLTSAMHFGIDNVIDPAETRKWVMRGLRSLPTPIPRESKKCLYIDPW